MHHVAEMSGQLSLDLINRVSFGFIVVNAAGEVLGANAAAQEYLEEEDGLRVDGERLCAEMKIETDRLRRGVASAASGDRAVVFVRRSRSERALAVLCSPLDPDGAGERRVLLTVREPGRHPQQLAELIRVMFSLSPAEAQIAVMLSRGVELPHIAQARGVSVNTLRVQLASTMAKVSVHRQSELVAAISNADVFL